MHRLPRFPRRSTAFTLAACLACLLTSGARGERNPPIKVPPGFTVERVAGPPLTERPMMGGFDDRGRLFVAESAGKNLDFNQLRQNPPNFIRMLEDTDGDGRFDKGTVFADRMTFPSGALWHDGALYVVAPPSLWKMEDTDDDGVADRRTEIVTGFGSIGNAADLHGPFLGPDGRIYFCDGRNGHDLKLGDGSAYKGRAAGVYRVNADGTALEVLFAGGMDNPVEAVFTPEGEALVSCNLVHGRPHRIDGILFGIEGGVYPYDTGAISELKQTGDLLEPVGNLGWVAVSGLARYEGGAFGDDFRGNLFSAQFNPHRVQRHVVERDGSAFRIRHEDFLTSTDPDFHPTDVLEDADGSLLVIDTGGWFRIGCPQSQIAKPDILGGIYRVRRDGAPRVEDPRGLSVRWDQRPDQILPLTDDPRPVVRERAIAEMARKGADSIPLLEGALKTSESVRMRRNALWALTRMDHSAARSAARAALDDQDAGVRLAGVHSIALHRDEAAEKRLLEMLTKDEPPVRRQAATALGRLRSKAAVPTLLAALRSAGDRFMEHALVFALIRIADRDATVAGLPAPAAAVRRGALIALDQMDGGGLTPEVVIPRLSDPDGGVRQTALGIVTARPQWAAQILPTLRQWLSQPQPQPQPGEQAAQGVRGAVVAFAKESAVQSLVAEALADPSTPPETRLLLLEAVGEAPVDELPAAWVTELGRALQSGDERLARAAVAVARSRAAPAMDADIVRLADDAANPADLRVAALAVAAPRLPKLDGPAFDLLVEQLGRSPDPLTRLAAAQTLAAVALDDAQLHALVKEFKATGAMETPHVLAAFEKSGDEAVGRALVEALHERPALATLSAAGLRRALDRYPDSVKQSAAPLLARLEAGTQEQQSRLAELEPLLTGGDPSRGQAVFFGRTAACATCHLVNGRGAQVGPDLGKIGSIRAGRDLLESVVFPSASIARGYESFQVQAKDGKVHTGTVGRESADAVVLRTPAEVSVPRASIKAIRQERVSIMPKGLEAQLSRQELQDLLAFLQSLK